MRDLKDNSNINETNNNPSFKEPKQQSIHSKNAEVDNNGDQQQNMEIMNVISYIEQTMKTLKNRTAENTTRHQFDPIGHVIKPSKKGIYKRDISTFKQKS